MQRLRVEAESLRQERDNVPIPPVHSKAPSPSRVSTEKESWLTGREAFGGAVSRGFIKSQRTFQRLISDALATQIMPPELKQVALIANWQVRREAKPKDNSVRWLRFEE